MLHDGLNGYIVESDGRPVEPRTPMFFGVRKAIAHWICRRLKVDYRDDEKPLGSFKYLCASYKWISEKRILD